MRQSYLVTFGIFSALLFPGVLIVIRPVGSAELPLRDQRQRSHGGRGARIVQAKVDYARFSHLTAQHKQSCDSCHKFPSKNWKDVRSGDDAFPDVTEYPEHNTCLGCHRKQFFARERPVPRICSNCHVNAKPVETSRHPFPSLGEKFLLSAKAIGFISDFRVAFPHNKHLEVIARNPNSLAIEQVKFVPVAWFLRVDESEPKSCATCHQTHQPQGQQAEEFVTKPPTDLGDAFWLKKGTFKTRPISHAACFTCHNQESELGPLPPDCNACHKFSTSAMPDDFASNSSTTKSNDWWTTVAWRNRVSSGTFRHESHPDLACTKCHDPSSMDTTHINTLKVAVASCGGAEGCHVTATADDGGILNYEIDQRKTDAKFVCSKCHLVFGTEPVPTTHFDAVQKAAAK